VIRAWLADLDTSGTPRTREVPAAEAVDAAVRGAANVWIDIEGEDEPTVRGVLAPFAIHPLAIADLVMEINRPKVDDYGSYLYVAVHSARWDEERPVLKELDIVLGEHYLVTYHDTPTRSVTAAHELVARRPELLQRHPVAILYHLLDALVTNYLPIADQVAGQLDDLEEDVLDDRGEPAQVQPRILRLKRGLSAMRRVVGPQRDLILALTRDEFRAIPAEARPYLRDVYDRLARVTDLLDSFRDEIGSLLDLYVSIVSNRLNVIIKRLTVVATIGLPLTVITSYYGMNFALPEYHWSHPELMVIGIMGVSAGATWLLLRWTRWT
jgi:magnesium transporter